MKVDSLITIERGELSRKQAEKLLARLTFFDADETEINAFQYMPGSGRLLIPRGAWNMLPDKMDVTDLRSRPPMPKRSYTRTLDAPGYDGQADAVKAMFEYEQGQIIAPPGRGKTEIVLAFAAACRTRVLVIVHTADLFTQWMERAAEAVPGMSLGKIQGKTCQVEHLTIATAQTLKNYTDQGGAFWRQFGAIIVDETHHAAAETWEWILNVCPAYYRFGVTASKKRSDGRQNLVKYNVGPIIYELAFKSGVPLRVVPRITKFKSQYNGQQWTRIVKQLVNDHDRNKLIADVTAKQIKDDHAVLLLSRQIKHLENIYALLPPELQDGKRAVIVTGRLNRRDRDRLIQGLREGTIDCILGTQLFEEGVDIPRLDRIMLAFPGTDITVLQKVGRGARKYEGKTETVVYDFVDEFVRVLAKQWLRRRTWYRSVGIEVEKPRRNNGKGKSEDHRPEAKEGRLRDRVYQVARGRRAA